jgi:hypothetical protein
LLVVRAYENKERPSLGRPLFIRSRKNKPGRAPVSRTISPGSS